MLYGCSSWVLTKAKTQKLQATQMQMLRSILGRKRKIDQESGEVETWVSWVRRTTAEAREQMKMNRIADWSQIVTSRQAKWQASLEGLDPRKWSKQASSWRPIGFRRVGRPVKRWGKEDVRAASL